MARQPLSARTLAALTRRAGHFLLEVVLFGAIVFLLLQRSYKPDKKPLTERVRAAAGACGLNRAADSHLAFLLACRRSTRFARSGSPSRWCLR